MRLKRGLRISCCRGIWCEETLWRKGGREGEREVGEEQIMCDDTLFIGVDFLSMGIGME
jgi:hypothetical protein